jgi:hypothetical protein
MARRGKANLKGNDRTMKNQTAFMEEQITNDGAFGIIPPYRVEITVEGTAPILFHRWSCEDVEARAKATKNSKMKSVDNIEAYLYRDTDGTIAIPGEYLRQSIIEAAKYRQDPRSKRKSARDLYKAGIISTTDLATTGAKEPDYLDKRRVCIMRSAITRIRPALNVGWKATFTLLVQVPEYIEPTVLNSVIADAGRLVGIGDFRPSYGRFAVSRFEVLND